MSQGLDLAGEADRLRWLDGRANTPRLVRFDSTPTGGQLLVERPPGAMALDHPVVRTPEHLLRCYATALRAIHELPVDRCPFDRGREKIVNTLRVELAEGAIIAEQLDPLVRRSGPDRFLAQVLAGAPPASLDLVVVHGLPRLDRLFVDDHGAGGWTDLGLLGVGERALDLACAVRSVVAHLGPEAVAPFMDFYDATPDLLLLDFYALLDQLR